MGSIKSSKFYNNPQIGQAFENLAAAFAPPSGADAAGWARASAEREQAARLAELFDYSKSEGYDQATADRMGVLGGLYTPDKSFYSINQADATTRRGQDVSAAASRYGSDRSYAASRENNTADNVRALATNEADNARALQDRSMQEAGALQRLYAEPVTVAQGARTFLPAQTAAATGLPSQLDGSAAPLTESQQLAQIIAAMPVEQQQQFVVDKMAPTDSQVQGQERRGLREGGLLTDQNLVDAIMGDKTPVEALGPEGKLVFMSPGEAVRTGAQPVQNKGSDPAPKVENWIGPDGTGGIAVFDRATNQYLDTSTKQPLPQGSRTYTGQLTGGTEATGFGKTTEAQDRNAYAATMAEAPTDRLLKAFDTGQLPTTQDYVLFNLMAKAPVAAAPMLVGQMTESGQTFYQDLRTTLPFQLMTQSGAAVTEQEYERKLLELIPVPGEAATVTQSKRNQFATYLKAVRGVSGAAYDKIHAGGDIKKPALPQIIDGYSIQAID
ncbi:hypothetical protein [Aureimonas phyllosphaerae]|uniref:Uncharacterized protein n=1 Tax=Aureimonas phyllosphaerae TaxID=1166078 RepID=A0A7W6BUA7_9HYPH|nr:hypothetical protein [Aureimonas phyllosphaerae]MBB3938153.1 hypothetical protein [Aureimonas phyllosphaerae]MBB3962161.1 hypothetical protein [Aureimonas phyllosphaerae]SFF56627.1 hypothetical protein SAMN05216566_13019 [Aureimonas phyllosphaerae]